ncbi:MAG TPA: hypothetical protein VH019_04625 [Rhizomicrobium sp.]|nr:hypothetical protein [Rhizomicrobium sp.]
MPISWKEMARATLDGAESDNMTFPESVKLLMEAGFDGYAVDYRRSIRTYYMPDGRALELEMPPTKAPVAERFDGDMVRAAIWEAQQSVPGYTYRGFCEKIVGAGCAGYMVSLLGKRVLYFGRTGETHTEYFPGTRPADAQ